MEILKKDVELSEVLSCYRRENQGSASFEWAANLLTRKSNESGAGWTLVLLSKDDILNIMLPGHRHPRENPAVLIPEPGMPVSAAAERVSVITQETGICWENIHFHKGRDFSQAHIFLQHQNGGFMNLDGLHRLLAWVIFEKKDEIRAYVLGLPEMKPQPATSSV
jgi:hypothetical protein